MKMKIALPWHPNKDRQFADEYNITFSNKPNNFENLIEFLSNHPDERFNITIDTKEYEFDFNKLKILNNINKNIHIVTSFHENHFEQLKDLGIKFYFAPDFPIANFRLFDYVIKLGVTDVYIMDDLCYDLKRVKKAASAAGVSVRLILNQIPSIIPDKGTDVRAPWFIPETIDELSKYIDVAEFDSGNSWARLEVLYKIWFKKKEWRENLRAINPSLEINIFNQSMIPDFAIYKMNCRYRCAYGSACKKCNQFVDLAKDLYNKQIEYIPLKTEDKKGDEEYELFN